MAEKLELAYFETSAKTGEKVEEASEYLVRECMKKVKSESGVVLVDEPQPQKEKGCFNFFNRLIRKLKKESN